VTVSRYPGRVAAVIGWRPPVARATVTGMIVATGAMSNQEIMGKFTLPFGLSLTGAGLAYLLLSFVHIPRGPFYRLVNARPMQAIGLLSYSLYLWQQPFLFPTHHGSA